MSKLKQYLLDSSKAQSYFLDNLEETNALSTAICKYVNFEKGKFYSLLPVGVSEEQLYGFKWGGIGGISRDEIIDIVYEEFQLNKGLVGVFDDVDATYTPSYDWSLFSKTGVHYNDEVYYVVSGKDIPRDLIKECFRASNAIWHSLCVIASSSFLLTQGQAIAEAQFVDFAETAKFIILGAYDEEGYVFWRRD